MCRLRAVRGRTAIEADRRERWLHAAPLEARHMQTEANAAVSARWASMTSVPSAACRRSQKQEGGLWITAICENRRENHTSAKTGNGGSRTDTYGQDRNQQKPWSEGIKGTSGHLWRLVENLWMSSTDQKVGGSNPSQRASPSSKALGAGESLRSETQRTRASPLVRWESG